MNDTLTLEHIAPYLPNDLTVITKEGFADRLVGLEINPVGNLILKAIAVGDGEYQYNLDVDGVKLSLLPLSALTEPSEDGTVPIVELAKIATEEDGDWHIFQGMAWSDEECLAYNFFIETSPFKMCLQYHDEWSNLPNQLQLFQYLFKHHFDVFGLIEKGLAIDKRTLK